MDENEILYDQFDAELVMRYLDIEEVKARHLQDIMISALNTLTSIVALDEGHLYVETGRWRIGNIKAASLR
jgi:hypothetical protein